MAESSHDRDMLDMATHELDQAINHERTLHSLLLKTLLPKDDADERDCILEVRAGIILSLTDHNHFSMLFLVLFLFPSV